MWERVSRVNAGEGLERWDDTRAPHEDEMIRQPHRRTVGTAPEQWPYTGKCAENPFF